MGREVRMVPPNWKHPETQASGGQTRLQPMHDERYEDAVREWKDGFAAWEAGERPDYCTGDSRNMEFWEWDGMPPSDREYYRPWADDEATWFQVWETVSEGTPVSPPFATRKELIEYLVANGDFWDQKRGDNPASRAAYEKFVFGDGWAPSLVFDGTNVMSGVEALDRNI